MDLISGLRQAAAKKKQEEEEAARKAAETGSSESEGSGEHPEATDGEDEVQDPPVTS
jgi:septal ring factor EnvC (AmiA/AmiB activator)